MKVVKVAQRAQQAAEEEKRKEEEAAKDAAASAVNKGYDSSTPPKTKMQQQQQQQKSMFSDMFSPQNIHSIRTTIAMLKQDPQTAPLFADGSMDKKLAMVPSKRF